MEKDVTGKVTGGVIVVAAAILAFASYFVVSPGEVAIKTRLGKVVDSYEEGIHFKAPLLESIIKFSIQNRYSAPTSKPRLFQRICRP